MKIENNQNLKKINSNKRRFLSTVFCFLFLFSIFYFLDSSIAKAAELRFVTQTQKINIGQQFQVDLVIDTKQKSINALEGKVSFPSDLVEIKEVRDGNSIVNFWIERPQKRQGEIIFSGITPGGFSGQNGLIFSLVFESLKEEQGVIEIQNAKALLNDGLGTESSLTTRNLVFNIQDLGIADPLYPKSYILYPLKDTDPPDSFTPKIANDAILFEGKHFLVFATQDKISGIDRYEIKEIRDKKLGTWMTRWRAAESPYILQDQDLRSYIFVKAVDNAGNERVEIIAPQNPLRWYENYKNWIILIILAVTVIIAGVKLSEKVKMKKEKRQ